MICFDCLLDHLLDYRMGRRTASKEWQLGWYYRRAELEVRDMRENIVDSYPWEYSLPGLDAAIHSAELLKGSVHIRVPVYSAGSGKVADPGFAIEVWPNAVFRCGDEESPLGDHEDAHTHGEN
jgi:hypothetical protein